MERDVGCDDKKRAYLLNEVQDLERNEQSSVSFEKFENCKKEEWVCSHLVG